MLLLGAELVGVTHFLDYWQGVGDGLAGTCAVARQDVFAVVYGLVGLGLDGEQGCYAFF